MTYTGATTLSSSTYINYYQSYTITPSTGLRTAAQFGTLASFCSSWSGSLRNEVCINGYDIAGMDLTVPSDDRGGNRLLGYYQATMDGSPLPTNTPIWEFDEHEGYPKLLQLDHH
ncbi:MAG: hypothetical protein H7281_19260 [Bacteriovorax sp.]|nr:hypothetical protein [Bacteriovorax sp.]